MAKRRSKSSVDAKLEAFLAALRQSGNVAHACRTAGTRKGEMYLLRKKDEKFRERWNEAMDDAADLLEQEALRRAVQGVEEPVFYRGSHVGTIRKYSDTLLIFLLKAARPEKFREFHTVKHEGSVDGKLTITDAINMLQGERGTKAKEGG